LGVMGIVGFLPGGWGERTTGRRCGQHARKEAVLF
jgi:hypothetical protein